MRTYLLTRPAATFIVRLWVEPSLASGEAWRGEVVRVQSGERRSFGDLARLVAHIAALAPEFAPAPADATTSDVTSA